MEPSTLDSPPGAPSTEAPSPYTSFDPLVLVLLAVILIGVSYQNWWLRRRAEGASVLPDWLRRKSD